MQPIPKSRRMELKLMVPIIVSIILGLSMISLVVYDFIDKTTKNKEANQYCESNDMVYSFSKHDTFGCRIIVDNQVVDEKEYIYGRD